ncbi:Mediator of RNA polymerase II transcription subunit 1 [Eumeta japonica]|uniref:Mediator of RNA polymerase II transcription subunit 1 n=1 Tax=Eumeta variegata TaxID=151549 RepID=A0A4C1U8W3_EUMVA|nr:Mediator of RNA polymerase II transcription subunit 1 [Eumeta japonica]
MTDSKGITMTHVNGLVDKSKELQKEILMEKLRSKTSQFKNLSETSKAVRMAMLDKRWAVDSADRMILQKCLDSLQHCIKISSLQSLIERLECLSRQLGLKFVVGQSGVNLFISSDMFYLEIIVEPSGAVKDVKIHHEGKVKCKAFSALQSLEADLCTLGQLQSFIKDPWAQVHKSPIGFLQKRRGGHAMRLTYFVSPYELLDKEKGLQPLTVELLTVGKPAAASGLASLVAPSHTPIGQSATVLLEGSTANKLQVSPIISVGQRSGKGSSGPVYAPLGLQNSSMLPACFTLKLSQPTPLCSGLAKLIHATTEVECAGDWANAKPMLGLVAQQAYNKLTPGKIVELNFTKGLFVNLPEQYQCYFLCETRGLEGCIVRSVPFTHPSHVPQLLSCLRQQALFNTLIASCVRLQAKQVLDFESVLMFEISALSWQHISISLEHPLDETMATVEVELSDASAPRASVYTLGTPPRDHVDEYISRVLQKSHSIPITLRCLIKIWEREAATKQMNGGYSALDNANFSLGLGGLDPGGPEHIKQEPRELGHGRALYPNNVSHPHQGTYLSDAQHHLSMMCQDATTVTDNDVKSQHIEERKSKKRKSDNDPWSATQKKGKQGICEMMDSESDSDNSDAYVNEDDNMMNSNSSNEDLDGRDSSMSQNDYTSDVELTGMDGGDAIAAQDNQASSDMENSNDGDAEDNIRNPFQKSDHKRQKLKSKDADKSSKSTTSSLLLDLTEGKSYMPSSVSITPISSSTGNAPTSSNSGSNLSSMLCLDRRPGIEIIPISTAPPAALPSSITITPITPSQAKSMEERNRSDKKSNKSGEEKNREKKKKRRRDDSMGPPEKVPPKQDPLTKPVSVSIKPTDGSPMRSSSPNSLLRKFSPSPTHGRPISITKSPSPSTVKSMGKPSGTSSHHNSPRHSPVQNSPKHLSGYSSPKNHSISSPKHSSSGSGKPSMSALKSATSGSPSHKSSTTGYDLSKPSKISKDNYNSSSSTSRDKDKKHSSLSFSNSDRSSPKLKNSGMKLKQLEITPTPPDTAVSEPLISPPNIEINKTCTPSQARNRKGSLSAVIDKLKSAQHCGVDSDVSKSGSSTNINKFPDPKGNISSSTKINDNKNQEYMVKPSSDGMKITINKTRSKDSSSSKLNYAGSGSTKQSSPQMTPPSQGSPKTHTGLKPGVISGPASKKTQVMQSSKPSSTGQGATPTKPTLSPSDSSSSSNINSMQKVPYSKSSSSAMTGINLSKSASKSGTNSPKSSSTDIAKIIRDREREKARAAKLAGGNSDKSIFSSKSERHSSPSGGSSRDDVDGDRSFKSSSKDANFLVEGLMKPLDTSKFQIPKLKNQNTPDKNSPVPQYDNRSIHNDFTHSLEQSKYAFANTRPGPELQKAAYPLTVPKPHLNMGSLSPKTLQTVKGDQSDPYPKAVADSMAKGESPQRKDDAKEQAYPGSYPMPLDFKSDSSKGFSVPKTSSEDRKGADSSMKPPASATVARSGATTPQEAAEMLLDFSSSSGSKVSGVVAMRPVFPQSPLLLAKSPAPSPMVTPSPHSNSPCITDDELMDEALVGPGK